jgi:hypothetical protein
MYDVRYIFRRKSISEIRAKFDKNKLIKRRNDQNEVFQNFNHAECEYLKIFTAG